MTTLLEDNHGDIALASTQTQSPQTTAPSQDSIGSGSTQNEQSARKNDQESPNKNTGTDPSGSHEQGTSKTPPTTTNEQSHETPSTTSTKEPPKGKIVDADGNERDLWYVEDDEDTSMTDATSEETTKDTQMSDKTNKSLEEGEIKEDKFGQFTDAEALQLASLSQDDEVEILHTSHPSDPAKKQAKEHEMKAFMKFNPYREHQEKKTNAPINIWVNVDVPHSNIEKIKTTMWHEVITAIFESDEDVKLLPRNLKSKIEPVRAGAKIPPTLFPDFITPPKINKHLGHGAVRFEFSFRIQQGHLLYQDLKKESILVETLADYNMMWFNSEIHGTSRTRMGFVYGKNPNFAHISNFASYIRSIVPKGTPPFDIRIEPQTFTYGAKEERGVFGKVFAAKEDTDTLNAGLFEVLGDTNGPVFYVSRCLPDEVQSKLMHQHLETQRTMTRMDVPSFNLDKPMNIRGKPTTIREYFTKLKDPTGQSCRLDIEKVIPKSNRRHRRGNLPAVLMIPADCPNPNWASKHVMDILMAIKNPQHAIEDSIRKAHPLPQAYRDLFVQRAAQVPEPTMTYQGGKNQQSNTGNGKNTWASKVKKPTSAGPATMKSTGYNGPAVDDLTARLKKMEQAQQEMGVKSDNAVITLSAQQKAMETLKTNFAKQEASLQEQRSNLDTMSNIVGGVQDTQRSHQSKLDALTGVTIAMYQVLKEHYSKNTAVALGCDPIVASLALNFQGTPTRTTLDDRFAAVVEIPQEGSTDDATAMTMGTAITGMSEEQYKEEIDGLDMEIAQAAEEETAAKTALEQAEWNTVKGTGAKRGLPKSPPSTPSRNQTGVRTARTPDHNRYADLADSKRSKHDKESKSDDKDSLDL